MPQSQAELLEAAKRALEYFRANQDHDEDCAEAEIADMLAAAIDKVEVEPCS